MLTTIMVIVNFSELCFVYSGFAHLLAPDCKKIKINQSHLSHHSIKSTGQEDLNIAGTNPPINLELWGIWVLQSEFSHQEKLENSILLSFK